MLKSNILRVCLGSIFLLCLFFSQTAMAQEAPNREDSQNYRSPNYRIHLGDVLQVSVSKHPELSRRISVRGDGIYILPPEGEKMPRASATDDMFRELQTVGFTAVNIAAAFREKPKPMIANPQVTITVVDTIMKPGPPSDSPSPQLRDTPSPAQKQGSANT
jgi:protein involved in polysaccharide export with SLBB domain